LKIVVFMLLFVAALFADRDGGPYIGIGYGSATLKDKGYYGLDKESAGGLKLYGGAFINKYLSVGVEYNGDLKFTKQNREFSPNLMDVYTQAHYPFYDDMFDIYAKFGVGEVHYNYKGFTMVYGIGASWRMSGMFALRIGYDFYDFGIDENLDDSKDRGIYVGYGFGAIEVQF